MHNNNFEYNKANSILTVKSSPADDQAIEDLLLPEGKSIAQLLYDQQKEDNKEKTEIDPVQNQDQKENIQ